MDSENELSELNTKAIRSAFQHQNTTDAINRIPYEIRLYDYSL